jgi:hypothetical protein
VPFKLSQPIGFEMALNNRNAPSRTSSIMDVIEERPSKKQTGYVIPPSPQRNTRVEEPPAYKYYERPAAAQLPAGLRDISSPLNFKSTNQRLMSPKVDAYE